MPTEQAMQEMRGGWRDEDDRDEDRDACGVLAGHGFGPGFEDLHEADRERDVRDVTVALSLLGWDEG